MSQDSTNNSNRGLSSHTARGAAQNYMASDDVHRIAMRRPALYETMAVPKVTRHATFEDMHEEEL